MSEALANLVRARLKNGKAELNEHDLYKLGLLSLSSTIRSPVLPVPKRSKPQ